MNDSSSHPVRSPLDVVQGVYESHEQRNTPALVDLLHPEVEWYQAEGHPYAGEGPWRGPAEVVEHVVTPVNEDWDGFITHVEEYIDAGDRIIVLGRYTGTHRRTAVSVDAQVCAIYTVEDGMITQFRQYTDTHQLRVATDAEADRPNPSVASTKGPMT